MIRLPLSDIAILSVSLTMFAPVLDDYRAKHISIAWDATVQAVKSAFLTKYNDYGSLIRSAKTLEEIEAVWPATKAARTTPQTMAVSLLTPDLLTRIQADQAATKRYMARHPATTQATQPELSQ